MAGPEARLQRNIQKALKDRGVWLYKVHGNEFTPAGIPDLVGVFQSLFVAWEVKTPVGKLSEVQVRRIAQIRSHGGMVAIPRSVNEALEMVDHIESGQHDPCMMSRKACPYLTGEIK